MLSFASAQDPELGLLDSYFPASRPKKPKKHNTHNASHKTCLAFVQRLGL